MFHLLKNNIVISSLVSIAVIVFIYFQNCSNKEQTKHGLVFYVRLFALLFVLLLCVLYFKTGELKLPTLQQGGAPPPLNNFYTPPVVAPVQTHTLPVSSVLKPVNLNSPSF
jgi:hypothetical protein